MIHLSKKNTITSNTFTKSTKLKRTSTIGQILFSDKNLPMKCQRLVYFSNKNLRFAVVVNI